MKTEITKLTLSLATILTLGATSVQAQNLLQNGSFENFKKLNNGSSKWKRVTLDGWNSTAKLYSNKLGLRATDGKQKLVLDRTKEQDSISQTVTLESGKEYKISFDAYAVAKKSSEVEVVVDGSVIGTINPSSAWGNHSLTFKANATEVSITLQEVDAQKRNQKGAVIDNVVLERTAGTVVDTSTVTPTTDNNSSTTTTTTPTTGETLQAVQGELLTYELSNFNTHSKLIGEPEGMSLNSKTGVITWQPINAKSVSFKVKTAGAEESFNVEVQADSNYVLPNNNEIFISPKGSNSNSGTYNSPLADVSELCGKNGAVLKGKTIYYRGGVYSNPDFGTGTTVKHKSRPALTCSGTEANPLKIQPWGEEQVKIKFDSAYGVQIAGNHVRYSGFEIEGVSQDIKLEQAIDVWWDSTNYFNGQGLNVQGVDVEISNNVIHDVPGAGINTKGNATVDRLKIHNNIIFNASWWSAGGTTALGIVGANQKKGVPVFEGSNVGIEITDNLIFSSESRIFSHVFSKGFSNLTVDEGSTMLLKQDKGDKVGTYKKGFLVKNNFFLFNGKGTSMRWNNIQIIGNTFYNNGTTMKGSGAGVRSSEATDMTIKNNIIYNDLRTGLNAIDFNSAKTTVSACSGNRYYTQDGAKSLKNPLECAVGTIDKNKLITKDPFTDVSSNQFDLVDDDSIGASQITLEQHMDKLELMGFKVAPTNYTRTINGVKYAVNTTEYYKAMEDRIVEIAKDTYGAKVTKNPKELTDDKKHGYKLTFPDSKKRPEGIKKSSFLLESEVLK